MTTDKTIDIHGDELTLEQYSAVVHDRVPVQLSPKAIQKMSSSKAHVDHLVKEEQTVYGVTTGFGKFSDHFITSEQSHELQLNLIKSHACGVGEPLPEEIVRGMMLLRVNALAKGYSGISPRTVQALISLLNQQIHPIIPSQGSLGASGDLAPLAHMCLPLLGLGEVSFRGQIRPSIQVLNEVGLEPIQLEPKEGLALINGTQMMCSLLTEAIIQARTLLLSADIISALTLEALQGIPHAFHPLLQQVRGHQGQITTAKNMLALLDGSELTTQPAEKRVQDAYSLRCIPQVHGASKDAYHYSMHVVETEMNAVTDNPLIFPEIGQVISGGNFHGQPLALVADFLKIALAEIANISERRTERLVNPQLSGLPAFLIQNGGLHSGYMILQYVAASLVSENKVLCHPASVDSIPSSANQEDHVSMGSIGARKCLEVIENTKKVLAIEYLCAAQALEFTTKKCGRGSHIAYQLLRESLPPLTEDREGYKDIEISTKLLQHNTLVNEVTRKVDLQL
ncbi:histidine ammonia-lyase [Thermoflavimicrobium daqui]|jgi:histidine ammonia-lyase|uniref:Histidine ammonia-lyase n=1 Tax=Thermoflavimicrobium daqui TaxID=2137476 RepID=A0A364K8G5_9BACL|nr:histidine ammonia-lyase [Thermoflavimicrobium daqui]RAL26589.1 histidine ammonia-lyase [Thermoflavimicrobium daqui]